MDQHFQQRLIAYPFAFGDLARFLGLFIALCSSGAPFQIILLLPGIHR